MCLYRTGLAEAIDSHHFCFFLSLSLRNILLRMEDQDILERERKNIKKKNNKKKKEEGITLKGCSENDKYSAEKRGKIVVT